MGEPLILELDGPVALGPITMGATSTHLGDVVGVEALEGNRVRVTISLAEGIQAGTQAA